MPTANPIIDDSLAFYGGELSLDVNYSDDGGYPEQGTLIQWYRDGSRQGELDGYEKVSATYLDTDDYWYAMVRPRNDQGTWGTWTMSDIVWIINTPVWAYSCPGVYTVKVPFRRSSYSSSSSTVTSSSSSSFSSLSSISSFSSSSFSSSSSSFSSSSSSFSSSSAESISSSSSSSGVSFEGIDCTYVGGLSEDTITPTTSPDGFNLGTATIPIVHNQVVYFRPERGGWDLSFSGGNDGDVAFFVLDNMKWLPFVNGTTWTVEDQICNPIYINSVFQDCVARDETFVLELTKSTGVWDVTQSKTLSCTTTAYATCPVWPSYTILESWPSGQPFFTTGGGINGYYDQEQSGLGVYPTDKWTARILYRDPGPAQRPELRAIPLDQTAGIRGGYTNDPVQSQIPLYYATEDSVPYIVESNDSADAWWSTHAAIQFNEGTVTIVVTDSDKFINIDLHRIIDAYGVSLGGRLTINISGGFEGQVIRIAAGPTGYNRWWDSCPDMFGGVDPRYTGGGYNNYEPVGWGQGTGPDSPPVIPGATYYRGVRHVCPMKYYWGTGFTGYAGTIGIEPKKVSERPYIWAKKEGGSWVVKYVNWCFLINSAEDGLVTPTWAEWAGW